MSDGTGSWSLAPRARPASGGSARWWTTHGGRAVAIAGFAAGAVVPLVTRSASRNFLFSEVLIFALIGLSVTVLTGWAGQLSLGQFAFVALGAITAASLVDRGMEFPVAVAYATLAGAFAAVLVGFPALRIRGMFLAVTTLAFAVATQSWLLGQHFWFPHSPNGTVVAELPRSKILGFIDLHSQRTYYLVCLIILAGAVDGVARLRRTGIGRTMIAVRDNDPAAAAFGVSPRLAKLTAFALAGALAALAGALLAGLKVQFSLSGINGAGGFGAEQSYQVVAMTVIGGLGSVTGAVLGALYVVGLPALFDHSQTAGLLSSGIGLLFLLLYRPGGLIEVVHRVRDRVLHITSKAEEYDAVPVVAASAARVSAGSRIAQPDEPSALRCEDVTVRFGGRVALDAVSINACRGEVVGLIGSNGAGKSTLMNVISGFLTPADGRVWFGETELTDLQAHRRARLGIGRVFQDARLFGDLTVRETVEVALEAHERSEFVPSLFGLPPSRLAESSKRARADDHIAFFGLERYRDAFISDLSTGTRRIVEMCCQAAKGSELLLLDEPTAGVAQREAEAFGPLIRRLQEELGATVVIIEHDMPLVMSVSDRVYCLAAGRCIAEGAPEDVRRDPGVIAAYLGTDERAIARSGTR